MRTRREFAQEPVRYAAPALTNKVLHVRRFSTSRTRPVTGSMGPITDHSFENLASSDLMIVVTRRTPGRSR